MLSLEKNPAFNLQLFLSVLNPVPGKKQKKSSIKILMCLGKFKLRSQRKGWSEIYPNTENIAVWSNIKSRETVSRFVNSSEFSLFGTVKHQSKDRRSNTYHLRPEIVQAFKIFKSKGLLKGIEDDFDLWLDGFKNKLEKWLLPLAHECETFAELMNKLSTRKGGNKSHTQDPISHTITPSENITLTDKKTKTEDVRLSPACEVLDILENRLLFKGSDVTHFFLNESLHLTKKCALTLDFRLTHLGWTPRSKVKIGRASCRERVCQYV